MSGETDAMELICMIAKKSRAVWKEIVSLLLISASSLSK